MLRLFKNSLRIYPVIILVMVLGVMTKSSYAQSLNLIRDTEIEETLKEWATPIIEAAGLQSDSINIILVQSHKVNAFVAGGSNIFVFTGLISKTDDPGELIGVLAHEMGHISGGHLIRTREAMERASYESIIGAILGVGAAIASGDAAAVPAISLGGASVAQRKFLAHSRVHESSADQAALTFLEKAKMAPDGLVSFMAKLKDEHFVPEHQQTEYVRTHPMAGDRVELLERRAQTSPHKGQLYPKSWRDQHARMKAKLVGFINPGQIPWVYDDKDVSVPAQYARAIAAYRNSQVEEALARMEDLIKREPNNAYFWELQGQMLVDFSRVDEAIPKYRKALEIKSDATLFKIALAHALIEAAKDNNKPYMNEAIGYLEYALQVEPRSPRIHRLLATAYGRLDRQSQAKIHLAEEAVLQRRFDYAEQHAESVMASEQEGSSLWIQAKDIISFIKTAKKG